MAKRRSYWPVKMKMTEEMKRKFQILIDPEPQKRIDKKYVRISEKTIYKNDNDLLL